MWLKRTKEWPHNVRFVGTSVRLSVRSKLKKKIEKVCHLNCTFIGGHLSRIVTQFLFDSILLLTLHRDWQWCFLKMLISDTFVGPDQMLRIMHYAWCLIRAYDICSAIRYLFAGDVTYCFFRNTEVRICIVRSLVKRVSDLDASLFAFLRKYYYISFPN